MSTGTLRFRDVPSSFLLRKIGWSSVASLSAALFLFLALSSAAAAQDHWIAGSVGKLDGEDISVEGGQYPVSIKGATTLFVSSGSVITVHSGAARLTLAAGGMVDICGPAKFTLLESGGAFTVALNFGRVRIRLADPTPVRIYTPFIIATPVAISNNSRDFTLGLDVNDLMCVYAAQGAAAIEQQFGGENLIVPELGEFFLPGERLPPVAGKSGSCRCESYQPPATAATHLPVAPAPTTTQTTAPPPDSSSASSRLEAKVPDATPAPQPVASSAAPAAEKASDSDKGFDLPANANRTPPITPPSNRSTPEAPAVEPPVWKVMMPALSFSASSPAPPPDSGSETALAIPDYHVNRDWVFTGHVDDPSSRAGKKSGDSSSAAPAGTRQKKKSGLWGKLRRFFGGEQPRATAPPAAN
jgi:hypothetical protein